MIMKVLCAIKEKYISNDIFSIATWSNVELVHPCYLKIDMSIASADVYG